MMCVCVCAAKGTWGTVGKKVTGHDIGKKEKKTDKGEGRANRSTRGSYIPKIDIQWSE